MKRHKQNPVIFFRGLLLVLVSLVLGLNIYSWNAKTLLADPLPMPLGYGLSVVASGSMEPVLRVNDLVLIRKTADVAVGDIVVYQRDGQLIIHRVISLTEQEAITQGDANNTADEPISRENIKGTLAGVVPGVGWVVLALRRPEAVIGVLVLALGLMELSYRRQCHRKKDTVEQLIQQIRQLQQMQKAQGGDEHGKGKYE